MEEGVMSFWRRIVVRIARWWRHLIERIFGGGGGTIPDDKCCSLARLDNECSWVISKANFTCPEGYFRQWWYCCEGTQMVACGECTKSETSCWGGPWECSIWWYTGQSC
jgi:hypothetical protein